MAIIEHTNIVSVCINIILGMFTRLCLLVRGDTSHILVLASSAFLSVWLDYILLWRGFRKCKLHSVNVDAFIGFVFYVSNFGMQSLSKAII